MSVFGRFLHWWKERIKHHLPVTLFLACSLTTMDVLRPDVLLGTETMFMRGAYVLDGQIGRMSDGLSMFRQSTSEMPLTPGDESRPIFTIVSLTPAAYARYLKRTSPVPRARLACLLYALGERLASLKELRTRPPVVAIDIDITPVDAATANQDWVPAKDEESCHAALHHGTEKLTYEGAMVAAIKRLARQACVVSITYPRFEKDLEPSELARSLTELRGTEAEPLMCERVHFTSPDVMQIPHELVYQFPTSLLPYGQLPLHVRMRHGRDEYATWPAESCTLGRTLGAYLYKMRKNRTTSCSEEKEGGDRKSATTVDDIPEATAYRQRTIGLGPAHAAIGYNDIDWLPRPPGKPADLLEEARTAFAGMREADAYVLTVDSGTTEDKFLVPVEDDFVPGAWVHAAVALTEYRHPVEETSKLHETVDYLCDVLRDILLAFALMTAIDLALAVIDHPSRHPVLREIGVAVSPGVVTALFGCAYVWWIARGFSAGDWHSPAPLLLGMAFHSYIDLATKEREPASAAERRHHVQAPPRSRRALRMHKGKTVLPRVSAFVRSDWIRLSAQLLWVLVLCASVLFGLLPESVDHPWPLGAVSLAASVVYLAAAARYRQIPLPWREVHATR